MKILRNTIFLAVFSGGWPMAAAGQGLTFSGQFSALHVSKFEAPWHSVTGLRYIPELKWSVPAGSGWKFDAEASANLNGSMEILMPDSLGLKGQLKPYRIWGRFSNEKIEIRLGLQKISFGSASMLRPLMWFDRLDPRDPLQLTDGVYAALFRYYFRNNANIWLWSILPGKETKGWEQLRSSPRLPELGGRLQIPAGKGELALSTHLRLLDQNQSGGIPINIDGPVQEFRMGIDGKWDIGPGIWFEGTYTYAPLPVVTLKHLRMLTVGMDYTFALGNGLTLMGEQFTYQNGRKLFETSGNLNFTAMSATYPLNMTHALTAMVFYNWMSDQWYRFINWRISLQKISLYLIAFWNPESFDLYNNTGNASLLGGKGLQLTFVWNH